MGEDDPRIPLAQCAHEDIGGGFCDAPGCAQNFASAILTPRPPGSGPVTYYPMAGSHRPAGGYGVRARLAWYWRRVLLKPMTLAYLHPPLGLDRVVIDPRPPWRKPRPGWVHLGYIEDSPPDAFRRQVAPLKTPPVPVSTRPPRAPGRSR